MGSWCRWCRCTVNSIWTVKSGAIFRSISPRDQIITIGSSRHWPTYHQYYVLFTAMDKIQEKKTPWVTMGFDLFNSPPHTLTVTYAATQFIISIPLDSLSGTTFTRRIREWFLKWNRRMKMGSRSTYHLITWKRWNGWFATNAQRFLRRMWWRWMRVRGFFRSIYNPPQSTFLSSKMSGVEMGSRG